MAVSYEDGAVGFITLNNPSANSYDLNFMQELDAAIEAANAGESRVVVMQSALEKFFSAGADIKAFQANTTEANMDMIRFAHAALSKIAKSDKIFIAAINAHALGGGLEMALACDLRFASDAKYYLGLPEVSLGLLPGNGGTQRLARLIGENKALEMMITGERVGPADALSLGIVNKVFPAESFKEDVMAYAEKLAAGASVAVGAIKRSTYDGYTMSLEDGLALERERLEPLYDTEDVAEGLAAFAEKRAPVYKGK